MRKAFVALLIILIAASAIMSLVAAEDNKSYLSKDEAYLLVKEAQLRYFKLEAEDDEERLEHVMYYKGYYVILQSSDKNYSPVIFHGIVSEFVSSNSGPIQDVDGRREVKQFNEGIQTEADLLKYIGDVFSGDLAERMKYDAHMEPIWKVDGDKIYYSSGRQGIEKNHELLSCGDFVFMSEDKAVMNVILGTRGGITTDNTIPGDKYIEEDRRIYKPSVETVEFTKTADGWRISGGTMFAVMLGEREPSDVVPPNTSDPTAIIIALLALSGTAIAVLPRKRRRIR